MSQAEKFIKAIKHFVHSQCTGRTGEYTMCAEGQVTLYSSCTAAMTLHYLNELDHFSLQDKQIWANAINRWQDQEKGYFIGPEIVPEELNSKDHDEEHLMMHLTAHALPALHLLGYRPVYPLQEASLFLNEEYLQDWLSRRDWCQAWLEGNNLLFAGQFLIYLRDFENQPRAQKALDLYFDWLDREMDPKTGLWGTQGRGDPYKAVYGAYHQLLVYYYCRHPLPYAERTMDLILKLQHPDGSFTRQGGGGACEDVDAVDILVNLYKRTGYRPRAVRRALQNVLNNILTHQMPDGGFMYRRGTSFTHMGIQRTYSPDDRSNLFGTWFRTHTIALICQVLIDHPLAEIKWQFNNTCSMGWHGILPLPVARKDPLRDRLRINTRLPSKVKSVVDRIIKNS